MAINTKGWPREIFLINEPRHFDVEFLKYIDVILVGIEMINYKRLSMIWNYEMEFIEYAKIMRILYIRRTNLKVFTAILMIIK